jgi:hypothetical protein
MAAQGSEKAVFVACTEQIDSPPRNEVTMALSSSEHLDEADKKLEAMGYKPVLLQFLCHAFQTSKYWQILTLTRCSSANFLPGPHSALP